MSRAAPFFLLLLLIGLAALALGADTPAAALLFAAVFAAFTAIILMFTRGVVGGLALAGLTGSSLLFGVAVLNNWISTGAGEYAVLVSTFGVFATAQVASRDGRSIETLWRATIVIGSLLAGASFIDFIIDPEMFWGVFERPYGGNRFSTPFLSANTAATFYGVIAILSLTELIQVGRRFGRGGRVEIEALSKSLIIPVVGLLLSLTCVFLTASRAGITLLAGAMLLLTLWQLLRDAKARRRLNLKVAGISVAVVFLISVVFAISGGIYADRMSSAVGDDGRVVIFAAYLDAIGLAPVFGNGLGGFTYINSLIADAQNARTIMGQGAAHNVALQWLLQGGIVGLAFILAIGFSWIRIMGRGLVRRSRHTAYIRATIITALFVCAHGMFDYALEIPAFLFLFAWICGLGAGVATGGSRTLGPGRWFGVSRATNFAAAAILVMASGLSFWAFADRISVRQIITMDAEKFRSRFTSEVDLSGSPARLAAIGDRALRLETPEAGLAARAFSLASEAEPRDGVLQVRFAVARIAELGMITPDAVAALSRSYTVMPYAPSELVDWRLDIVEGAWRYMPPLIQDAAIREARAYGQTARIERYTAASGS